MATGIVKWFDDAKGYGFIEQEEREAAHLEDQPLPGDETTS